MSFPNLHANLHGQENTYELKVYGEAAIEHRIALEKFPALGGKARFPFEAAVPGGSAQLCIALARRGWKVAFVGTVGDDEAGREWVRQMSEAGVDLALIQHEGNTLERWWFGDRGVEERGLL